MEQLFELFFRNGLRPLSLLDGAAELESKMNRSELAALLTIRYRGRLTMSELATELGAPLSTVTSLAQRLVRKGWIERTRSDADQRVYWVRLTDEGKAIGDRAYATMSVWFERVQAALTPKELEQFLALALKVGKALQQDKGAKEKPAAGKEKLSRIRIDD
ncbi:MarR family winged helix-turn-helix transcriptional regulator [Paenibacillus flagellatus]|uniref:Transcriptional regulator n=1 Tax=Paenibacillus flagellatus TaxID=2211139 RepID=A0A2V5KVC3_9BACL|nr:MarR family transcriptional regulator [Paenibacillus flagellatus]PYI53466.1 transcriptional regulator [Paenibacillus flagellatus]